MVNSILMLLARNVIFSNSILIISALATKKENDWVLPNGRQILENENMKKQINQMCHFDSNFNKNKNLSIKKKNIELSMSKSKNIQNNQSSN